MHDTKNNTSFEDFLQEEVEVQADTRPVIVQKIDEFKPSIANLALYARNLAVEDIEGCTRALDLTADIRARYDELENFRKTAIEPSRRFVQLVNDCVKTLQQELEQIESGVTVKMAAYKKLEDERTKAAEEAVRQLSESLGVEIVIPQAKTMTSLKASAGIREVTTFEIVDESLIPDEYWMINEKVLQKHIDLGKREIPGIKIVKDKRFVVRRK